MEIDFFGVRGSCPVADSPHYGGETSCLRLRSAGGGVLYMDAGSGLRKAGHDMPAGGHCSVFLSHVHWDHVQGLLFFAPLYSPDWTVDIYEPARHAGILPYIFDGLHFPLSPRNLSATINAIPYVPGKLLTIEGLDVLPIALPHPGGSVGLRVVEGDTVVALSGDCEIDGNEPELSTLLNGAELAVVDGQYNDAAYKEYKGWGHSRRETWLPLARQYGVGKLLFTHHDPSSSDAQLDVECTAIRKLAASQGVDAELALEGTSWPNCVGYTI